MAEKYDYQLFTYTDPDRRTKMVESEFFGPGLKDTYDKTKSLIKDDEVMRKMAQDIKDDPQPEKIAAFVAKIETKIPKMQRDMPLDSGNELFVSINGNDYVKGKDYDQQGCYGETAHTGMIVDALRDSGYLSKDVGWGYATTGAHWAPVIYDYSVSSDKERVEKKTIPNFLMDTWLVGPGEQAPIYKSHKSWQKDVGTHRAIDGWQLEKEKMRFFEGEAQLQTVSGKASDPQIDRKFDKDFLFHWKKENEPDKTYWQSSDNEAQQDYYTVTLYLGDKPKLPATEMPDSMFKSLRDRLAHIVENDKDNPKIKASGLTAEKLRAAKDFEALKPMAEGFYAAYEVPLKNKKDELTEKAITRIVESAQPFDDKNGKIDGNEIYEIRARMKDYLDDAKLLTTTQGLEGKSLADAARLIAERSGVKTGPSR